jgi:hypothetical protein
MSSNDSPAAAGPRAFAPEGGAIPESSTHGVPARGSGPDMDRALAAAIAVLASVAGRGHHGRPAPSGAPAATAEPFRGFDDIWAAFGRLKDALGLPAEPERAQPEPAGTGRRPPARAAYRELDDAIAEARACAAWYEHSPEWRRITTVSSAAAALLAAFRGAAGDYWAEISRDLRVRGFTRTVTARTCRAVSAWAGSLAGALERDGKQRTPAWRAASRLHAAAAAYASHIIGYPRPGSHDRVREAGTVISALTARRQDREPDTGAATAAAVAALGFPSPPGQITAAGPGPGRTAGQPRRPVNHLHH